MMMICIEVIHYHLNVIVYVFFANFLCVCFILYLVTNICFRKNLITKS